MYNWHLSIRILPFRLAFPFDSTNKAIRGGAVLFSWSQITVSCYTVLRSVVLSSSLALHGTRLIETGCNSCLQWGSVTCHSKSSTLYSNIQWGRWASALRGQVSLFLSSVLFHHFCCCIRRPNLILNLLMKRRWTWPSLLRHRNASRSQEIVPLLCLYSVVFQRKTAMTAVLLREPWDDITIFEFYCNTPRSVAYPGSSSSFS